MKYAVEKLADLRHLRPLTEVLGVDASRRQMIQDVTQNNTIANELRQIEHLRVVLRKLVIAWQYLAANQPVHAQLPVLLGHFDSRPHTRHFPISFENRDSDETVKIYLRVCGAY